jgi:hypothetical protein
MPATSGIADISIAGKARSYAARLSLFVVPVFGDGGSPEWSYPTGTLTSFPSPLFSDSGPFLHFLQLRDRQARHRSLPHRWQEKQSGHGCFFLPGPKSGIYIMPLLSGSG